MHRERVLGIEPGLDVTQLVDRAKHEPSGREQYERERHLPDNQRVAHETRCSR